MISEFRRRYIKAGILESKLSDIITSTFNARTGSDYNDFYVISKSKVAEQVKNGEYFLEQVKTYLSTQ